MSEGSETSQDQTVKDSQAVVVQTCDGNGLGEDAQGTQVIETTSCPPVTTPCSDVEITDNESELLELTISRLDACEEVVKVNVRTIKAENEEQDINSEVPSIHERSDNCYSVACQTDWSWLAAYRAIKDKLPQPSTSTIVKSKSGSKLSKSSVTDLPLTKDASTSSLFEALDSSARILDSLKSDPWPDRTDEYGIPIYESSEEEEFVKEDVVAKEEKKVEAKSTQEEDEDEEDEDDSDDEDDDDDEDDEDEDEDDEDDAEETEDSLEQHLTGICPFCGEEKKPFPSLEDQETRPPEELYCCSDFREYITKLMTESDQLESKKVKRGRKSKGTRGSRDDSSARDEGGVPGAKVKRKRAKAGRKSKGNSRSMEREGRRHEGRRHYRSGAFDDNKPCVVYGREMTTINYQLSSRQCMNWTLGLDGGATSRQHPETVQVVEPVQLQGRQSQIDSSASLLCQTYDNGSPFLVVFADGSGNVFYPSGRIAVTIISSADREYLYVVQDTNGRLLGIYEPNGRTITYHQNGSTRICTDETGGIELDAEGNRRKQWRWNEEGRHVHAPPLYQIICSISSSFTFSISSQHEMTLFFDRSHRACRFNVGSSHHGVHTKKGPLASDMLDKSELYIKALKSRIGDILQKTSTLLRLPGSPPRPDGSLTPLALQRRRQTPSSTTPRRGSRLLPAINH